MDDQKEMNVSNLLANYLVFGINPGSALDASKIVALQEKLVQAEKELRLKLNETSLDFPGLVRAIAIDMIDFLVYCEIPHQESARNMCPTLFEDEPFFSPTAGICWTSKWNFPLSVVYRTASIKIWTNIKRSKTFELDYGFHQSNAVERLPPVFSLPLHNHPSGAVRNHPLKLSLGETMSIELSPYVIDRTQLSEHIFAKPEDVCLTENKEFEASFKIPYTKLNCRSTIPFNSLDDCSTTYLDGYPKNDAKPPCEPLNILKRPQVAYGSTNDSSADSFTNMNPAQTFGGVICPSECIDNGVNKFITVGKGNFEIMSKALNQFASPDDILLAEDFSGLELFFASMDYSKTSLYRDGIGVFLSQVGGWMGLAFGASFLSLIELSVFFIYLCRLLCKGMAGQT
ncbi:uncharacterized protein LOC131880321 isoform X2 [Tigriopus californicus]|uniref:uncharacterized protein LOC131880321 isoform X2 n=1 Tax=Tigriopus californicus TaxID=6832 RepID=UPI0027DA42B1|nr:uncharacterized protein LOC131880321 isoform X2 [Tigriopus californicus]